MHPVAVLYPIELLAEGHAGSVSVDISLSTQALKLEKLVSASKTVEPHLGTHDTVKAVIAEVLHGPEVAWSVWAIRATDDADWVAGSERGGKGSVAWSLLHLARVSVRGGASITVENGVNFVPAELASSTVEDD